MLVKDPGNPMHAEQMSPAKGCRSLPDLRLSASILAWNVLVFPLPTPPASLATCPCRLQVMGSSCWSLQSPKQLIFWPFNKRVEGYCIARQSRSSSSYRPTESLHSKRSICTINALVRARLDVVIAQQTQRATQYSIHSL